MPGEWHDINDPGNLFAKKINEDAQFKKLLGGRAISDDMADFEDQYFASQKAASQGDGIRIHSHSWRLVDEARKGDAEARNGDKIRLLCGVDGCPDGTSVRFELSYKSAKDGTAQFSEASATLKDGTAAAELTLALSKIKATDYTIHFTPSARGRYGSNCDIPLAPPMLECDFAEIPDVCFNADSPIPCLDENGVFEAALVAAFKFAKENSGKEAVVFGHGGKCGTASDEFDLSKQRAELVLCLLNGGQDRFVEIAGLCATNKDWQSCLASLAGRHGWECDPGKPDGKAGPKTGKATEAFKKHCKEKLSISLEVNDKIDDPGWCAMYEVMRKTIEDAYGEQNHGEPLPTVAISGTNDGYYACGNAFKPEGKGYRSKDGRRAEILFFDKGKCPKLADHAKKTDPVTVDECPVYNAKRSIRKPVDYKPAESKVLRIKTIDGPAALAHNQKGVYTVTALNREATEAEKQTVCWVVMIDGKEAERHDKAGVRFEFTAIGKYAGEKITVHPFLRSPSDKLCVKTTVGQCLVFDGDELVWLDEAHKEVKKWRAWSGDKTHTDPAKDGGPIPAGRWVVLQSERTHTPDGDWWQQLTNAKELTEFGSDKIELIPFKTTETHGRKGFFIHGGKVAGSAHGIDLTDKIKEFVDEFVKSGKNLVLVVNYGTTLIDESGFLITSTQLEAIYGSMYKASIAKFIKPLNDTMRKYEINTPMRIAHFVAQVGHESARFAYTEEIASGAAYEGRVKSLGNTQTGDGKRFKGRGLIQITGRSNYTAYGQYQKKDFLTTEKASEIASNPALSCDVAGWYWMLAEKPSGKKEDLNGYADNDDVKRITELINGGLNGFEDRKSILTKAKKVLGIQ